MGFETLSALMWSLKIHAKLLMHTHIDGHSTAGPAWEYISTTNISECTMLPTATPPGQCNYTIN